VKWILAQAAAKKFEVRFWAGRTLAGRGRRCLCDLDSDVSQVGSRIRLEGRVSLRSTNSHGILEVWRRRVCTVWAPSVCMSGVRRRHKCVEK
jgi:hypothetical protein